MTSAVRRLRSSDASAQEIYEAISDLVDHAGTQKSTTFKTVSIYGKFPIRDVDTGLAFVDGLSIVKCNVVNDETRVVNWSPPFWYRGSGPGYATIGNVQGLSAGTLYNITLRCEGS